MYILNTYMQEEIIVSASFIKKNQKDPGNAYNSVLLSNLT